MLSPDRKVLTTRLYNGGPIHLWDVATKKEIRSLDQPNFETNKPNWSALAFTPDSKQLASVSTPEIVQLWDVSTGEKLRQFHTCAVSLAYTRITTPRIGSIGRSCGAFVII